MSRLIDADDLKGLYDPENYEGHEPDENWDDVPRTFAEIRADIDDQPTVDAVPVVRCIECKYASFSFRQGELNISCENTEGLFRDVPEDGYCYWGEKVTE